MKKKKFKERAVQFFWKNDIALRIYISFLVMLALLALMIGVIFLRLYEKNYLRSYTKILDHQSITIARRVSSFAKEGKASQFQKYADYIDQMEIAEETDVWIVSNQKASSPLTSDYTNADTQSLTKEMYQVLSKAFQGKTAYNSSFDQVYGMVILRVASPIYANGSTGKIKGAVMMISMLDKQSMGVKEGKYLISFSIILSIFVAYLIALFLSRYLSHPIRKMDQEIMRLSRGNYEPITHYGSPKSQLGRLEMALNDLAVQLYNIQEERENLDRVRQDFFANVSHELRTPITVIRGYAESLSDGVVDENQLSDCYDRMVRECQSMERLVGDLFILSKMQNPDFQIKKEPVSLIQIFSDIHRSGGQLGAFKKISIQTDFPQNDPCMMLGDYDRLRQMFLIIVDNAIKFSQENGQIDIALTHVAHQLQVSIQDYGVGISPKELPYIFEKFYKSKLKQNENGTGLGLMIAKQIAIRHDGQIQAESTLGKGTKFSFVFHDLSEEELNGYLE